MKKIIIFSLIVFSTFSCSVDDGVGIENSFHKEILPIENVNMPSIFTTGNTYSIQYAYLRRTNCHSFDDLYLVRENNTITIAVIDLVTDQTLNGGACETLEEQYVSQSFDFFVNTDSGTLYTFKFWQGVNEEDGEDLYLVVDVPVIQ